MARATLRLSIPCLRAFQRHAAFLARQAISFTYLIAGLGCLRKIAHRSSPSPPEALTKEIILRHLEQASLSLSALRVRFHAVYEGERKQAFQFRLAAQGDSIVWLSAGFMGFEGLRLLWRKDSVFILNRLRQEFYVGTIDSLRMFLPAVAPSELIGFLLGLWMPSFSQQEWKWLPTEKKLAGQLAAYQASLQVSPEAPHHPLRWDLTSPEGERYTISYTWKLSSLERVELTLPQEERIILTPKEIELNPTDLAMPFSVPSDYRQRSLSDFSW
ncbi:MAG: DUF4292 domain-containing protein [Bacteroidia bacterium]|nr:DUF4292 domain-containing protein [Bacteroidia bacterium]MDW8133703.1 DUF4292 domain-containing protein [Bacteroidia bacterium]